MTHEEHNFDSLTEKEILELVESEREDFDKWHKSWHESHEIAVIPSKGVAKAPFDGIVIIDSTAGAVYICADNGVVVNVSIVHRIPGSFYGNINPVWHIKNDDIVKKGDILFEFDITKLPPNSPAVVTIDEMRWDYDNAVFILLDKTKVSFEDTIIEVEGELLKREEVEKVVHDLRWSKHNNNLDRIRMDMKMGAFSGIAMYVLPPEENEEAPNKLFNKGGT